MTVRSTCSGATSSGPYARARWSTREWSLFSYPPRWHYDLLKAVEYFARRGGAPDPRLAEAVDIVRAKRRPDGRWLLENTHPGAVHVRFEGPDGTPSRWNTLRALRVLRWYDASASSST